MPCRMAFALRCRMENPGNLSGGRQSAGAKLKEAGFGALAGGFRNGFGVYSGLGTHAMWWSATWNSEMNAWYRLLTFDSGKFEKRSLIKLSGFSVRCVKN